MGGKWARQLRVKAVIYITTLVERATADLQNCISENKGFNEGTLVRNLMLTETIRILEQNESLLVRCQSKRGKK